MNDPLLFRALVTITAVLLVVFLVRAGRGGEVKRVVLGGPARWSTRAAVAGICALIAVLILSI